MPFLKPKGLITFLAKSGFKQNFHFLSFYFWTFKKLKDSANIIVVELALPQLYKYPLRACYRGLASIGLLAL